MTIGRPTLYSSDVASSICAYIASGKSLIGYCKQHDIDYTTVAKWLNKYPEFFEDYARARLEQAEFMADEIIELSDETPDMSRDKNGNMVIDSAWVTNQKNRVEARKWIIAKLKPSKYGDKQQIELTGKDGAPLSLRLVEMQQRLLKDITPDTLTIEHIQPIAIEDII